MSLWVFRGNWLTRSSYLWAMDDRVKSSARGYYSWFLESACWSKRKGDAQVKGRDGGWVGYWALFVSGFTKSGMLASRLTRWQITWVTTEMYSRYKWNEFWVDRCGSVQEPVIYQQRFSFAFDLQQEKKINGPVKRYIGQSPCICWVIKSARGTTSHYPIGSMRT